MKQLNTLIVDDEKGAIESIVSMIADLRIVNITGVYTDPYEALYSIKRDTHLILLDVEMPELSGIDFIKSMSFSPKIIFVTAFSQYAFDGYDLDVVDFLLKPVERPRLIKALNKCYHQVYNDESSTINETSGLSGNKMIKIRIDRVDVLLRTSDIVYVESEGNNLNIWTVEGKFRISGTLKEISERLPADTFIQIHKSYIISIDFIKQIIGNQVVLENKLDVAIKEFGVSFTEVSSSIRRCVTLTLTDTYKEAFNHMIDKL
jgi:two-component system LytT family response regulator